MISVATGQPILCCWTDCERTGDDGYQAIVREPGRNVHYLFCSQRHLMYWTNSIRDMGNLPAGAKSLGGPVQGWGKKPKG